MFLLLPYSLILVFRSSLLFLLFVSTGDSLAASLPLWFIAPIWPSGTLNEADRYANRLRQSVLIETMHTAKWLELGITLVEKYNGRTKE